MSLHHMATEHHSAGSEIPQPDTSWTWSIRLDSELPFLEDVVNLWCCAVSELLSINHDNDMLSYTSAICQTENLGKTEFYYLDQSFV